MAQASDAKAARAHGVRIQTRGGLPRLRDTDVRPPEASEPLAAVDGHEVDGGAVVGAPSACAHRMLLGLGRRALPQLLTSLLRSLALSPGRFNRVVPRPRQGAFNAYIIRDG